MKSIQTTTTTTATQPSRKQQQQQQNQQQQQQLRQDAKQQPPCAASHAAPQAAGDSDGWTTVARNSADAKSTKRVETDCPAAPSSSLLPKPFVVQASAPPCHAHEAHPSRRSTTKLHLTTAPNPVDQRRTVAAAAAAAAPRGVTSRPSGPAAPCGGTLDTQAPSQKATPGVPIGRQPHVGAGRRPLDVTAHPWTLVREDASADKLTPMSYSPPATSPLKSVFSWPPGPGNQAGTMIAAPAGQTARVKLLN